MIRWLLLFFHFVLSASIPTKPTLTLDEFFEYVHYPSISLSPDGRYLLIQTRRPLWDFNTYNNSLWLYETQTQTKTLITDQLSDRFKPKWSPSGNWILLLLNEKNTKSSDYSLNKEMEQNIHVYCIISKQLIRIPIGMQLPSVITWADTDSSLYFATIGLNSTKTSDYSENVQWKDVIQYRKWKPSDESTIYHMIVDRDNKLIKTKINVIKNVAFKINELLFSSSQKKLIFTSVKELFEQMDNFEIYSIDLQNMSSLSRLTTNEALEENLKLSSDGKHVLFTLSGVGPTSNKSIITQDELHALDLTTGKTQHLAKDFDGNIREYTIRPDGGVYILGQVGTNVQIYTQQSPNKYTILHRGWEGTYESITSSLKNKNNLIAFLYSSYGRPKEVYIVDDVNQLETAKAMTTENKLFKERALPQAKTFQWTSDEDDRTIEGVLHYPPGKFECKNLPLFVLIHGGPYAANINQMHASAGLWAPLAATEGWLVLEPNYRGSTGYGNQFLDEIRYRPLTRTGRDILSGINRLVQDGIVDGNRLSVGGYSYGGFLTNWLITQTTRFNAALSGSGSIEQVSMWGTMDLPVLIDYLWGGFPWNSSDIYIKESPIYQINNVRTPTHIVTGEDDVRVPASQSYILERALHYLDVPVQLLIFPNEGHPLRNNPWHGKIKVREELKWLKKYGHTNLMKHGK